MCLIMRRTPNGALVDRVDFATPLSLSSRSVTSLSALAPAQRAGAQRLCALAHRDLASKIHVRNAPESGRTRTDVNDPNRSSASTCRKIEPLIVGISERA